MKERTLNPIEAMKQQALMNHIKSNGGRQVRTPEWAYSIRVGPSAMLVEPINNDPYVFVPPCTLRVFVSQPGSGTDFLRQRIFATLHFEGLEQPNGQG